MERKCRISWKLLDLSSPIMVTPITGFMLSLSSIQCYCTFTFFRSSMFTWSYLVKFIWNICNLLSCRIILCWISSSTSFFSYFPCICVFFTTA